MKSRLHLAALVVTCLVFSVAIGVIGPSPCRAQEDSTGWGPAPDFDWSDFRFTSGGRIFLARLLSASLNFTDLKGPRHLIREDPEPIREAWAELWIDRLGIRLNVEDHVFKGRIEPAAASDPVPMSELNPEMSRLGFDLDLIRYPFLRFGTNIDVHVSGMSLWDRNQPVGAELRDIHYTSLQPITIGLNGRAIPFRFREVPFTVQGRVRAPVPFLDHFHEIGQVRVVDWEISGGLRPVVWEQSFIGNSTFSVSIEAGFRSITYEAPVKPMKRPTGWPKDIDFRGRWQGAFFQVAVFF